MSPTLTPAVFEKGNGRQDLRRHGRVRKARKKRGDRRSWRSLYVPMGMSSPSAPLRLPGPTATTFASLI